MRLDPLRNVRDVVRVGQHVLGKTAVAAISAKHGVRADRLPRCQTILAVPASRMQPRDADAVAFLHDGDAGTECHDASDGFVSGHERKRRLERPVARGRMHVRMAHAARLGLHEDLARAGRRNGDFSENERFAERFDDRGLHRTGHD